MPKYVQGPRITIDLGSENLHKRLKKAAIDADLSVREVVIQAVEEWMNRHSSEKEQEPAGEKHP